MNTEELVNIFKEAYSILDFGSNKFGVRYGDGKKVLITVDNGKEAIMFGNEQGQIDRIRDALRDLEVKVSKLEFNIVKLGYYQSSYETQEAVLKALLDHLGLDWEHQPEKIVLKKKGKS